MDQEIINEKLSERLRTVAAYDGRSLADELEHLFEIEEKIGTEDLRRFREMLDS